MSCRIRELGGANARPNAEALGKKPIKKRPVLRASAQQSIKSRMSALKADISLAILNVRFVLVSGRPCYGS
jgi:hypothetical protein